MMNNNDIYAPSINIDGKLYDFSTPWVMGILNVTPDSFYKGSRNPDTSSVRRRINEIRDQGADCIDLGGYSTRPGAQVVPLEEEWRRLEEGLGLVRELWPEAIISVDTFRAEIARRACRYFGAQIINDVSGGTLDQEMFPTVASLGAAYVLMHMRGTPTTMQSLTQYEDVTAEVLSFLAFKTAELRELGVRDIILDPGFGFAKTVDQSFRLLADLPEFVKTGLPVLAGMSRKSMIWKPLGITPEEALPGTITLHTKAILDGAAIIRVHDVAAARQSVDLISLMKRNSRPAGSLTKIELFQKTSDV